MTDLPDRFARAVRLRDDLGTQGIFFAPIRHHSPACALAVKALIDEVAPAVVLIEGPAEYDRLLPDLVHRETTPPVAILSLTSGDEAISSFFPLVSFSPEWVALRTASARGIPVAFIDESWSARNHGETDEAVRSLQSERYFAESQSLAALAQQEHCRNSDELWEHLFELREPTACADWRTLFEDVFAWSALARLDYEPEVLVAEGSVSREAVMTSHITDWRDRTSGPLVVVTGGFHTLALVESLAWSRHLIDDNPNQIHAQSGNQKAKSAIKHGPTESKSGKGTAKVSSSQAWLIRYDLTRLDAYSGYGAGIRSPGYYQRYWDAITGEQPLMASTYLIDIARLANEAGTSDQISLAEVMEASLHAERLATLRGHPHPGRTDLLDACTSCFVHGEVPLPPSIRDAIAEVFGGSRLGILPPGVVAPPIVAEARGIAEKLRFNVSDSAHRQTTLDVRRSAQARLRSRYLSLMTFLGTGFARKLAGPDYISGRNLGRMREEWDYAWTPMVEAQLISVIVHGATLTEAARHRLRESENNLDKSGQSRSSEAVAHLTAQAALIGLDDEMTRLAIRLDHLIEQDPSLMSVLHATSQLLGLWRARDLLDMTEPDHLVGLVARALPQLAYLIDESAICKEEDEPNLVTALVAVNELARDLDSMSPTPTVNTDPVVIRDALARLRQRSDTSPGVLGAALALGTVAGHVDDGELQAKLHATFAPGADQGYAVRFLAGLMQAAPDLVLYTPEVFDSVDAAITALDSQTFVTFLPDLRRSFSWLKPFETAQVAEQIALKTGFAADTIHISLATLTEADLRMGLAIEQQLHMSLVRDGLETLMESGVGHD